MTEEIIIEHFLPWKLYKSLVFLVGVLKLVSRVELESFLVRWWIVEALFCLAVILVSF